MTGLANGMDYAVATICFLVAAILLSQREGRRDHVFAFAAFLLSIGFDRLDDILVAADLYNDIPAVMEWALLLKLFQPLAIYAYTRAMTSPSPLDFSGLSAWHLVACVVGAILVLPYLTLDGGYKLSVHLDIDHPADDSTRVFLGALSGMVFIFYLTALRFAYLAWSFRLIARHNRTIFNLFSNVEDKTLSWLRNMILILGVLWLIKPTDLLLVLLDIADLPEGVFNAADAVALGALAYFGLCQGAIYDHAGHPEPGNSASGHHEEEEAPSADADTKVTRLTLSREHAARIKLKLDHAMQARQLYRDSTLTLRQLSDATQVSVHRISEVLNRHMETNFYDFVNGWRIEEAKSLLQGDKERSVLDVAMDVGFNSKSTFYTAFKKSTDESPAAFRKRHDACEVRTA